MVRFAMLEVVGATVLCALVFAGIYSINKWLRRVRKWQTIAYEKKTIQSLLQDQPPQKSSQE